MNARTLTKEALKRWETLSRAEQKKLLEELQPSQAIELEEPEVHWPETFARCKARVVSIAFGMNLTANPKWRYLFKSDIPQG